MHTESVVQKHSCLFIVSKLDTDNPEFTDSICAGSVVFVKGTIPYKLSFTNLTLHIRLKGYCEFKRLDYFNIRKNRMLSVLIASFGLLTLYQFIHFISYIIT